MPRPKKIYPFDPKDIDLFENKFRTILETMEEKTELQEDNVFSYVVPSLVCLTFDSVGNKWKNACYFPQCHQIKRSYATRQKLIQHLQIHHTQEIPDGGRFLSPNDSSVVLDGFLCQNCGKLFNRKDHFTQHRNSACRGDQNVANFGVLSASHSDVAHYHNFTVPESLEEPSVIEEILLPEIGAVSSNLDCLAEQARHDLPSTLHSSVATDSIQDQETLPEKKNALNLSKLANSLSMMAISATHEKKNTPRSLTFSNFTHLIVTNSEIRQHSSEYNVIDTANYLIIEKDVNVNQKRPLSQSDEDEYYDADEELNESTGQVVVKKFKN